MKHEVRLTYQEIFAWYICAFRDASSRTYIPWLSLMLTANKQMNSRIHILLKSCVESMKIHILVHCEAKPTGTCTVTYSLNLVSDNAELNASGDTTSFRCRVGVFGGATSSTNVSFFLAQAVKHPNNDNVSIPVTSKARITWNQLTRSALT